MGVPEGSFAVATFVVIALPGFIYASIRRRFRGESIEDRDIGLTIARGAVFAITLTAVYLVLFGPMLFAGLEAKADADALSISDPSRLGITVLVLYVAVPTILTMLIHIRHTRWPALQLPEKTPTWILTGLIWIRVPRSRDGYSSIPNAWNHAVSANSNGVWVKVRRSNGDWIGGWYTEGSAASMYPEPRSLYIAEQYEMTSKGGIQMDKAVPGTGIFLMIGDDDLVIWSRDPGTQ